MVKPADHRDELAAIYERWRQQTPGGLVRPKAMWDELLADREWVRRGGTELFAFLHPDGYALYRVFGDDPMFVRVGEFTAATTDAHVALSRALLGLDLMEKVVFGTHPADPLPYLLTDHRLARITHIRGRPVVAHHGHPDRAGGAQVPGGVVHGVRGFGRIPQ